MKTRRVPILLMLLLVLSLVIAGCGQAARNASEESLPGSPAPATSAKSQTSTDQSTSTSSTGATEAWDRYVIKTATASLVVKNVDEALSTVRALAESAGGYVSDSTSRRDEDIVYASLTIKVPSQKFDQAIEDIKKLAIKVDEVKVNSQDVTEEYVDNEARLKSLRASEERILALLAKSDKIDDILKIQSELTKVRTDIEKIEGRQNYLKRRVEMSTITIQLRPEAAANIAAARDDVNAGRTARDAWEMSLTFLSWLLNAIIAVIVFLAWWAIPLGLLIWWLIRRSRRNRVAKAAVKASGETPPTGQNPGGASGS